jgi:hypothetical protein
MSVLTIVPGGISVTLGRTVNDSRTHSDFSALRFFFSAFRAARVLWRLLMIQLAHSFLPKQIQQPEGACRTRHKKLRRNACAIDCERFL